MPTFRRRSPAPLLLILISAAAIAACSGSPASDGFAPGPPLDIEPVAPPIPADLTPDTDITLPPGFVAYPFAGGLDQPTSIAFDPLGRLFVAELNGVIRIVEDLDGDGTAGRPWTFWRDPDERTILGLAVAPDGSLYVSAKGDVLVLQDTDGDGRADEDHTIISGLPHNVHQNNGIAFGPDGMLYITNGSTCNLCRDKDERSATILRSDLDGSDLTVYARGLRNPYDLAFDGEGHLWATANEHDFFEPADEGLTLLRNPPEELNYIVQGGHYGWPECAGRDQEMAPGGCEGKTPPIAEFQPHSSADGLAHYDGANFPAEYRGDFFVAQYGSDPRSETRAGQRVVRVEVSPADEPSGFSATVTEFATGLERPLDVTVDALGTLYVADFGSGTVYRIIWRNR